MSFDYHSLTSDFAVGPQLDADDMMLVKQAGFKSVIINRPDYEAGANQPYSEDVIEAAQRLGLQIVYQPIGLGQINPENIEQFANYLESLPKPILAYCKTGARCFVLFEAAHSKNK